MEYGILALKITISSYELDATFDNDITSQTEYQPFVLTEDGLFVKIVALSIWALDDR